MGKLLKIFLSLTAAIVLILVIAAVALPLFFNPNDFKPQIEAAVQEKIGRKLHIEGDLKLSLFPWLGLRTEKVTLDNSPEFQGPFLAQVEKSDIKVKLLPLLSQKIEIDRIVLEGLSLNLVKNEQGIANWSNLKAKPDKLTGASKAKISTAAPKALGALAIAGVTFKNANLDWNDKSSGSHILIKALNFETGTFTFAKPIPAKLDFILENPASRLTETVKLTSVLTLNEQLDHIIFDAIDLATQTTTPSIPGGALDTHATAKIDLDLSAQLVKISDLKLSSGDLKIAADISGTEIKDNPVFEGSVSIAPFNLGQFLRQRSIGLPDMSAADALARLSANFNLQATPTSADLQNIELQLDASTLKGSARIDNFSAPAITFNLAVNALDLDRYLAPESPEQKASSDIASPAAAVAAGASLLPIETLQALDVNGLLAVDQIKVNNLSMQGLNLKLTANKGVIHTEQSIKTLYQGSYQGGLTMNVQSPQPTLTLNENLSHVQIEPLLKDLRGTPSKITGNVDASARLEGVGNSIEALTASLDGQIKFLFKDSVIKGFNLQRIIDNAKSIINNIQLNAENPKDQTVFTKIEGTAEVTDGLIVNNDLMADSAKIRITGKGSADLKTRQLDYQLTGRLIEAKATATTPEELSRLPVLLNITGSFDSPVYTLDVAAMLIEKNRGKIDQKKEKILDKLDEKLEKQLGPGGARNLLKQFF
ncbi:MAG: AsmA family protein [Gammaproteobacteria bacterium HGW-Gammaproteobacteria-3]|nr:MAG: AsmA family protein [Gammaproteobacteria bacterium HGW-Gammaproteobacteria-3]